MSPKTQERLLFLISPIGLIALWQMLPRKKPANTRHSVAIVCWASSPLATISQ